jgi:hypothetical protein
MSTKVLFLIAAFSLVPIEASARLSDVLCDDADRLAHQIETAHGAEKQGHGLRGPDALVEFWISPTSGDWLLVQSYANGTACIVAMGEHWQSIPAVPDPA